MKFYELIERFVSLTSHVFLFFFFREKFYTIDLFKGCVATDTLCLANIQLRKYKRRPLSLSFSFLRCVSNLRKKNRRITRNPMSSTTATTFKSPFVRFLSSYVRTSQRVEVVPRFLLSTDRQRGTRSYEVAVTGNQQPPQQPP